MTTPRKGGRFWRWLRRGILGLIVLVAVLACLGIAYQAIATSRDEKAFPAPGQLVDIGGGRHLHILCAGAWSPTVILESGLGGFSADWTWVTQKVAPVTRVCAYDRAGVGWSDPGPLPRDAKAIAADLRALLDGAGAAGPYVLAGHSYGGLYVRAFAAAYPGDVAGMVLVDSSHEDQWTRLPGSAERFASVERIYAIARIAARVGVMRLTNFIAADPDLAKPQAEERKARSDMTIFIDTAADEFAASAATSESLHAAGKLGDKPLYVLSAGVHGDTAEVEAQWQSLQAELVALSTNAGHSVVSEASHMSLLTKQKDAGATSAAILAVVEAVRGNKPLAGVTQ